MVKISRITTQKNRKERYNIFISNNGKEKYAFSVDEAILAEFRLRKGLELDEPTIEKLMDKDSLHKSYSLAITYLSYRMRTKKEMRDYLLKKEVDPEQIPEIMTRLEQEGLLDDKQFAEAFVQTRINTSAKGPLMIKKELLEKGVPAEIADHALLNYSEKMQYEKALAFARKKWGTSRKKSIRNQLQQLQGNLIQKGFAQDVVQQVLDGIKDVIDEDGEWDALVYQGEKLYAKHKQKLTGFPLQQKIREGLYRKGFRPDQINQFINRLEDDQDEL